VKTAKINTLENFLLYGISLLVLGQYIDGALYCYSISVSICLN